MSLFTPAFSIFTPSHNPAFLRELYWSLERQTFGDWEWVVVLNHGAVWEEGRPQDPRVHVLYAPPMVRGIGALKAWACSKCRGEYLVEVDHDDKLTDNALEVIDRTILATNADFLYSDCVEFRPDGTSHKYGKQFGWTYRDYLTFTVNESFPPNASSLSAIFYAPNHVRVWKREAYERIGGHDPKLEVCDDYDLVCRTYLQCDRFVQIPECLYFYRLHDDKSNTFLKRNAEIQTAQKAISDRYLHALIQRWCEKASLPMLDLGGGSAPQPGFVNVDIREGNDAFKWLAGLKTSTVGCIRAYDFLEHIPHCRDSTCPHYFTHCVVELMNEIYRVLVPGGWVISATPSTDGRGAFQDPTHCSFWNPNSFWYYTRQQQRQFVPGIKAKFQAKRLYQSFPSEWHKEHNIPYVYADLVALKGQRQPGLVEVSNDA